MKFLWWLLFFRDISGDGGSVQWPPHFPRLATPLSRLIFVLVAIAAIAAIVFVYRREPEYVARNRRRLLMSLRIAGLAIVLFVITGAFLDVLRREDNKRAVVLLFDASASMSMADRRTEALDLAAGAKIAPDLSAEEVNRTPRADLVKKALLNQRLGVMNALNKNYKVEAYAFGQNNQLSPLSLNGVDGAIEADLAHLPQPAEQATQLGAALRDTARRLRGRRVDGIVVFTDGGLNRGEEPLAAAKELGSPVFPIGVGLPQNKDLAISFLFCEDVVFKGDSFPLTLRIKQRGFDGKSARIAIRRDDQIVKEDSIDLDSQAERVHVVDITPDKVGVFAYSAEIETMPEELITDNNRKSKANVTVIDKKIRVLLVDDSPRWEMRYLQGTLEADTARIAPSLIIRQVDERVLGADNRYKKNFPATLPELRNYDVIVLGNMPSDFFTRDELKLLETYVREEGGGLLLIAGRNGMPDSYAGTPIVDLLPIEFEPQPAVSADDEIARSIKTSFVPVLTAEGRRSPLLRFAGENTENEAQWAKASPLYWFYPAKRLKPGATAFLSHPNGATAKDEGMPLIASQRYGKGQVVWMGVDETWRWRFHPGPQYHRQMWGQIIGSLSMSHLLGKTNRIQLESDRPEYVIGDKASVIARVLDKDFNKLVVDSVTAVIEREGDLNKETIVLLPQKDQPGLYQGTFAPGSEGSYRIAVQGEESESEHLISVTKPRIEFDDPGMRQDLLEQIADESGGKFLALQDVDQLPANLDAHRQTIEPKREERSLWNAPGLVVLFALLFGLEWFLRKRSDLL